MRAEDIGPAAQHMRDLIVARTRRRHLVQVETMSVNVECPNGCCYDEIEVDISDAVRLALLEDVDAEIAVAVEALQRFGVTELDKIGTEDECEADDAEAEAA